MREIKFEYIFRYKDDGKWVYGKEVFSLEQIQDNAVDEWLSCCFVSGSELVAIRQYTGLKDKSDREIFEGDVLRIGNKKYNDTTNIAEVRYYRGGFMMYLVGYFGGRDIESYDGDCEKHEIIGNLHENPELLK